MTQKKRTYNKRSYKRNFISSDMRIYFTFGFFGFVFLIIVIKLFWLQVVSGDYYSEKARQKHWGKKTTPASRGEILVKDIGDNYFALATNEVLNLIYVDPKEVKDKVAVSSQLAKILFDESCTKEGEGESKFCDKEKDEDEQVDLLKDLDISEIDVEEAVEKEIKKELTKEDKMVNFSQSILEAISKEYVEDVLITYEPDKELVEKVKEWGIMGLEANSDYLWAYPLKIVNHKLVAQKLADYIDMDEKEIERKISPRLLRYVPIANKISVDVGEKIKSLNLKGVVVDDEEWRVYPEGSLLSQTLGFIDRRNKAQYGIEERFNSELAGREGVVAGELDPLGRQTSFGQIKVETVKHGDDVILTIDRVVQYEIEKILKEEVEKYQADAGQIIIMEPYSGNITAVASYPTFDPNDFTEVYKREEVTKEIIEEKREKWQDFPCTDENEKFCTDKSQKFYIYKNIYGPGVYKNPNFTDLYEPGSVFKVITMSAAIDSGEVEPNSTYFDYGPIEVDMGKWQKKHYIKNSEGKYRGRIDMIDVLKWSSNTGISYVAKKLGRELFYDYIKKFGFADFTNIDYTGELSGKIKFYPEWSEVELYTYGFGQGFSATPIQVVTAVSAIANGGYLMEPNLVLGFRSPEGKVTLEKNEVIRTVITKETSEKLKRMMVLAVRDGVANRAQVPGHNIAGKTGTSQTYKFDKVLSGPGSTIATFVGFAPIDKPKFVILIKLDRPKTSEWGSRTAAPFFRRVASFLFDYYKIPPDIK